MTQESEILTHKQMLALVGKSHPLRLGVCTLSWMRADVIAWLDAKAAAANQQVAA